MNKSKKIYRSALLATLLVAALGCSGSSSSGSGGPIVATACLDFSGVTLPPGGPVFLREDTAASSCDTLVLEAVVNPITDLFGVSFDLAFDPAIVGYGGLQTTGSILESGGVSLIVQDTSTGSGSRSVGISRTGVGTGVNVATPEVLFTLTLTRVATSGSGGVTFTNESALDSDTPPATITAISWAGGTVSVL